MNDLNFRWQNVVDGDGIGIALTGMAIVFLGLVLISLFIALLPRLLAALSPYLPPESAGHHAPAGASAAEDEEAKVLAAIGYVLHLEMSGEAR